MHKNKVAKKKEMFFTYVREKLMTEGKERDVGC
jgi:hypothetical protein